MKASYVIKNILCIATLTILTTQIFMNKSVFALCEADYQRSYSGRAVRAAIGVLSLLRI